VRYLPSAPIMDAARAGRPWHVLGHCPYCERGTADRNKVPACVSAADIAATLGIGRDRVEKWRQGAQVLAADAERLASALGLLDFEVWPQILAELERECAGCGGRFVPTRKDHRFCKPNCRQKTPEFKAAKRARYASDDAYREHRKAKAKASYRESQRAKSVKRRLYYLANREREIKNAAAYRARRREAA
jgi:hypothetical protein